MCPCGLVCLRSDRLSDLTTAFAALNRCPDILAGDIFGRTNLILRAEFRAIANATFSRFGGQSTRAGRIVFRQIGCYHPCVAIIAGGHICLTEMGTGFCGF